MGEVARVQESRGLAPEFNVVIFQRGTQWVAQGLEYDLTAQAESLSDLPEEFFRVVVGHMYICRATGDEPFESLPSAPREYWKQFEAMQIRGTLPTRPVRTPHPSWRAPQVHYALG